SVEQLRKSVRQRKDEIASLKADIESKQQSRTESRISARWRIDELKREIEDLHRTIPDTVGGESEYSKQLARRAKLARGIDELTKDLPSLITEYERLATELAETKRDVVRKRDAKENPSPGVNTSGMSEMEARAARLVAQRMAALTGQTLDEDDKSNERIKHEIERVDKQHHAQLDRAKAVQNGMEDVKREINKFDLSAASAADTSKWQEGVGLKSEEVKELIDRLKRIEKITKPKFTPSPNSVSTLRTSAFSPVTSQGMGATQQSSSGPSIAERLAQAKTKQERDQLLKDMAEERFRERQRALGLPVDPEPEAKKPELAQQNSNPFAAATASQQPIEPTQPAAPYSGPNFANSLELDNYSDTSSEEWDNDSDDEPEKHATTAAVAPEASTSPTEPAAQVPDPNNPFHGLIAAASADDSRTPAAAKEEKLDHDNYQQLRLRALYPYHPDGADELPIETGDLVETKPVPLGRPSTLDHSDEGWMYGVILKEAESDSGDGWEPSGKIGWFPKDYAETLGAPGSRGWNKTKALFGTAKYDYEPQHDDELKVAVGDRVRVVDGDKAESWWKVRKIGDKKEGMLPAMYIDLDE
ncbi:actin organization and endocytosis protein, partial [Linderina pennispora]